MKKKLVALLLAAMMILSVLPAVASADGDVIGSFDAAFTNTEAPVYEVP